MYKILGGAIRCGKSTLAKTTGLTVLSTDSIRREAREHITDTSHPLLAWSEVDRLKGKEWADRHIRGAHELTMLFVEEARSLEPFIQKSLEATDENTLIEGAHILPDFALKLSDPRDIIYIIDTSEDQYKRVFRQQQNEPDELEYVHAWSYFNRALSDYLRLQCQLFGVTYYDISDEGFDETIEAVHQDLMAG